MVVVAVSLGAHSALQSQVVELGAGWTEHVCTNLPNFLCFLLPLCSFSFLDSAPGLDSVEVA